MKRRLISLLLALALSIGLVLPAYAETAATENTEVVHLDTCLENCALEDCACECHQAAEHTHDEQTHAEGCADDCAVEGCACECHVVTETPTEETVQHVTMCGGENCLITDCSCQCHAEPEVTEEPTEAPSEEATEAPSEEPTEAPSEEPTEAPSEEPTEGDSNVETLYNAIMACTTAAEVEALLSVMTEEEFEAFALKLTEEQQNAVISHLESLAAAAAETGLPEYNPAVNYTNAAPFLAPVVGEAPALFRLIRAATGAVAAAEESDNGLSLNKSVTDNGNGNYTLNLEAWATGSKTITSTSKSVPTDIILVLDQSGSMNFCMYGDCNNQSCSGTHRVNVYTATYSISTHGTYYYKDGDTYLRAYYCSGASNYFESCDGGWFSQEHGFLNGHGGTKLTPKTSADAEGTQFYTATTQNQSFDKRLTALSTAVKSFVASVNQKAAGADGDLSTTADNVDHRIAVVGFASKSGNGNNTEILSVSGSNSGTVGVAYNNLTTSNYQNALQDVSTAAGQTMVNNAVNALAAEGATEVNLGIQMANNIFQNNPIAEGEERNRVVIVFTDGTPTTSSSYSSTVANSAISQANTSKNTYHATVYSIGIFGGANGSNPANLPADNSTGANRENRFMHLVSSNYPNATNMSTPGALNSQLSGNSYYLSASNSAALTNIFQIISSNIESGGSSITLNEEAVLKDVITEQFVLPEGASASDIKVYTADYTAADTFADPVAFDATVEIGEDGRAITVTNFDYAENWVGTETAADGTVTYRGKKLIIEIPIEVRDGFIGGNGVYTNASGSGIYENADAEEPLEEFVSPTVDVEISAVTVVTAPDHNVYLLGGVTAEQLENALTVTVGDVTLDMDAENYGLEDWQYAYVTMGDEATMTTYTNLTEDATYTATVTVEPKTEGTATAKSGSNTGNINVFKPVITFQDTGINVGETADYDDNFVSVEWKHGETVADTTAMGEAPALTYTYDIPAGAFTADTKVSVTVNMGETDVTNYVTFEHEDCTVENITCTWIPAEDDGVAGAEFIVHIKSFDLTITKTGANETLDPGQTFIFYITGPNGFSKTVIIEGNGSVTIAGLPVGTYTIEEDTSWSWRYTCTNAEQTVTAANVSNGAAKVTFVNDRTDDQWLDGNTIAENIFDVLQN